MKNFASITVLFVAGLGPIVREARARKLYHQNLGISFEEESGGYLHTETLNGAKTFALNEEKEIAQEENHAEKEGSRT